MRRLLMALLLALVAATATAAPRDDSDMPRHRPNLLIRIVKIILQPLDEIGISPPHP